MSKKLAIVGTLIVLIVLTVTLGAASTSSAAPRHKAIRYRVIGHMKNYDVVRGHHRTLRVRHHRRYANVNGARRYRIVKRNYRFVVLRRVASAAPATTVILAGTPVSVGMPSTASSVLTGTPPAAANDGRADTRWAAAGSRSYPQWWTVDLGVPTTVYGVKAAWYGNRRTTYRYRIETSVDGVAFTTVADRSRNQTRGTTTDALTAVARYVRVTVVGVSPSGVAASAYEITVNGDVGSTPPPAPEPVPVPTPTPTPTPTATPTVTPTVAPAPGTFNVNDYGALHNGTHDDAPAIMTAMLTARAAGGGTVYLPAGTYNLDQGYDLPGTGTTEATWHGVDQSMKANIVVFSNCTLAGDGVGKTILIPANTDSRNCVGSLMQSNVGVHDLSVVSPKAQAATTIKDCYKIMACTNGTFYNLTGQNSYIGTNFSGGQNMTFTNCRMSNCRIGFSGRTATDAASAGGAYYMPIKNVTFTSCEASGATASGIAFGFAIYEWQDTQPNPGISNITLNGCFSHDNDNGGVYTRWVEHLTILNSTFSNPTGTAVQVRNTHNYWLAGNTATGNLTNALPRNDGDSYARSSL